MPAEVVDPVSSGTAIMSAKRRKPQRKANSGSRQSGQAPGWAWMLFGLSIGLAVALVVYLRSGGEDTLRVPASIATVVDRVRPTVPATAEPEPGPTAASGVSAEARVTSATPDSSGAEPTPVADELSFFDALPRAGVEIPASEIQARTADVVTHDYMIQAGSFRTVQEADSRRAQLALLAVDAGIESALVNGVRYHRVMIGPLSERGDINRTLRQLRDARIEYILLTLPD